MNTASISISHQPAIPPWRWAVTGACRLPATPAARWLVVGEGRVWLTRSRRAAGLSDDVWLGAGERLALPAGSDWVIEGWPHAQVELLLAAPIACSAVAGAQRSRWRAVSASWRTGQPGRRSAAVA